MPKRNDEKPEDEKRQREEELRDLWGRRDDLNESEWDRLYNLINLTLAPSAKRGRHLSLLNSLHELTCEDYNFYFNEYFIQKVFLRTRQKNFVPKALVHSKALHVFFKRYLLERLARIKQEFAYPKEKNDHEENDKHIKLCNESSQLNNKDTHNEAPIKQKDASGSPPIFLSIDSLSAPEIDEISSEPAHPDLPDPDWRPSPEQEWLLWDIGLDLPTLTASARDFFNRLTPEKQLLFKECFVNKKPLSDLQGRVRNVYEKAAQLGVKMRKNEEEYADYRNTDIGLWLTQPPDGDPPGLGLSLQSDEIEVEVVFMIVFQILPACALDGVDADRPPGTGPDDPPQPDA